MGNYYHFLENPAGLFIEIKPVRSEIKGGKAFNSLKFLANATKVHYPSIPDLSDKEITLHVHTIALAIKQKYEAKRGFIAKILEFVKHLFCITTEYDQILKLNKQIQEKQYIVDIDTLRKELFLRKYFSTLSETVKAGSNFVEDAKIVEKLYHEDFPDSPTAKEIVEELKSFIPSKENKTT